MKHCEIHEQKEITDKLREECGVFGIYDFSGENVASTIYYGLFALQHRGQESCGIAVSDTKGPKGKVLSHKGMGLVNEVFDSESMEKLAGDIGVGHVRYSTAGGSTRENAQPLVLNYIKGTLALAHTVVRQSYQLLPSFASIKTFLLPCTLVSIQIEAPTRPSHIIVYGYEFLPCSSLFALITAPFANTLLS